MRIARRGLGLAVTEQPGEHRQTLAERPRVEEPIEIVRAHCLAVSSRPREDDRSPPMLPVIRAAAFWIESRVRCAYRAVV